jgi:hypothetical protein
VTITKTNRLMPCREIGVYCQNPREGIQILRGQNAEYFNVAACSTIITIRLCKVKEVESVSGKSESVSHSILV